MVYIVYYTQWTVDFSSLETFSLVKKISNYVFIGVHIIAAANCCAYDIVVPSISFALPCRYMKLQANPKSTHIKVIPAPDDVLSKLRPDQTSHSAVYVVHGVTVGTTHLMFNATTVGGKVISSWPSEIQVFDALKLSPEYITLLPTAVFQVSHNYMDAFLSMCMQNLVWKLICLLRIFYIYL